MSTKTTFLLILLLSASMNVRWAACAADKNCQSLENETFTYLSSNKGDGREPFSEDLKTFSVRVEEYYRRTIECRGYYLPDKPTEAAKKKYVVIVGGLGRLQGMTSSVVEKPAIRENPIAVEAIKREYVTLLKTLKER
jgi:hypothetical protein